MIRKYIHPWSRLGDKSLVELVENGIKPICQTNVKIKTKLSYIELDSKVTIAGKVIEYKRYIYYRDDTLDEAVRAAKLSQLDRQWTEEEHREFGLLMGYDEDRVNNWVKEYTRLINKHERWSGRSE